MDPLPIIHDVLSMEARNLLTDSYEGKLVRVAYDPFYPGARLDDPASNPTGRVYRLRLLEECNLVINSYGHDDTHWELAGGDNITVNSLGLPVVAKGRQMRDLSGTGTLTTLVAGRDFPDVLAAMEEFLFPTNSLPLPVRPVITFAPLGSFVVGDSPAALSATSTNQVTPITFASSNAQVASVALTGGVWRLTVVGQGSATITASQAASTLANFSAASVSQDVSVGVAGNTTPAKPIQEANDATDTYALSSPLGASQIVVNINNTGFVAYAGPYNIGNVDLPAGYYQSKVKAAAGRNESLLTSSPAFTKAAVAPEFNTPLVGPREDEPTGTQLVANSGDVFKFNKKPLGDGTGKVMQLTLNGQDVIASIDFLTPYQSRLDGGAGGELFSFQPKGTGPIYYGRFKDVTAGGLTMLTTSYAI